MIMMFVRFLFGFMFIYGIGGVKYDELIDEIIKDYFGFVLFVF